MYVSQDERPLLPPFSACFYKQFQQNQRSWFHPGVDSRFHRSSENFVSLRNQEDEHIHFFLRERIFLPGEEDEGAHPHDGLELADGKGFVAVSREIKTRYLEQ